MDEELLRIIDLFDNDEVTTADKIDRPSASSYREEFDNFNARNPFQFGGGADAQKMGMEASRKYFETRSVDKPTPKFEGGMGKAKVTDVKFKNKTQENAYIKLLKNRFEFPKGSKEARKIASNADIAKKFNMTINNVERVNKALINKLSLKYPTQTYEGLEKIQRARDKKRKEYIKKTSSGAVESKIKRDIKKVDANALANDVDIAHRASLKANANLGTKYLVSSLGIDKKVINQSVIKPIEQKLGTLYENQKNLIKNYKSGDKIPLEVQKKLEKINIKISELTDRTNGVLQGVLVDEKTLKPRIYGIDYSKALGFGLIDKPVDELTQADRDIIKLNVGEQIKAAKKVNIKNTGMKLNAKIPGVTELFEMAKSIPDDIKRAKYLKAGFKFLGIAAVPLVINDTYNAFIEGKPILETLEQGIIGTDIIGGTKRFLALTPEEKKARSVVKQDALKDLNVDMPMGFGFIEGPDPMSDLTLEEAQAQAAAGDERVKALEAQKNFERATDRSNFFSNIKDKALGIGPDYQLELAGGGIAGLSGGIDEGPQRTSMNPDSQGLRSLKNRVRNL